MREIKRAIKYQYGEDIIQTGVDESGFLIVKATVKEFGKIMFINRCASTWLGYENNYLVSKTINCVMPQIIAENHHKFWRKFNEFGVSTFLEREQSLFMRDSEGYIFPVRALVKFSHEKIFGHSFIAIFNKEKSYLPFLNQKKYISDELMVVMTDDKDNIIEINKCVNDVIGLNSAFVEQNSKYISDALKIE